MAPQGHVSATTLAEQREHAEWVRDYLKIEDMDGISAHSLNGRLLVVLDVADKLLAELEQANAALREHS